MDLGGLGYVGAFRVLRDLGGLGYVGALGCLGLF